jgi:ubiquinone/menaquinone biosynthesis C-methylase UbiE
MSQLVFDENIARQMETLYRTRDVLRRRALVRAALAARPGERVLDVGCGPGFYTEELLDEVGREGAVVGVDASPQMLAVAAKRCERFPNVAFQEGDAIALPVQEASFDAALCVQVLEYVADATAALAQMHRALRPGGRVVVWDVDWGTLSWHSEDPERMARVLRAWDEHLTHPSLPRTLAARLRAAGFGQVGAEGHVFATTTLDPEAFGSGVVLTLVEQYAAGRPSIGPAEASAWAAEQRDLGARGELFFACTQFCFTAVRER